MNDIVSITDPGWNHAFTFWMFGPPLALLFGALVFAILRQILRGRRRQNVLSEWAGGLSFAALIGTVVCVAIFGVWGGMHWSAQVEDRKIAAMEDLGYTNVTFQEDRYEEDDRFIASSDGDYFEGSLVEDGNLRWQLVEMTAAR